MAGAEQAPDPIGISSGSMVATVNLQGAYLETLQLDGNDLLYPRQVIEEGGEPKTRGGLHICSPYFGPGQELGLDMQHGFARREEWEQDTDNSRPDRLAMVLNADDERFGQYRGLWQRLTFAVDDGSNLYPNLACELEVRNPTRKRMAVLPGLHPYFPVHPNASPSFKFLASEFTPETTVHTMPRTDMPNPRLLEHRTRATSFVSMGRQVTIDSRDLTRVIIWSGTPGEYVCVEPTRAAFLGSQAMMPMLEPGAHALYRATITWKPKLRMEK